MPRLELTEDELDMLKDIVQFADESDYCGYCIAGDDEDRYNLYEVLKKKVEEK